MAGIAGEDLDWETFKKADIRIGTILNAEPFPKAIKPAYRLLIDFGTLGRLKSSAQITSHYLPQDLIGRQVLAVVNFPSKQVADFMSECLVLGAYDKHGMVVLIQPDFPVDNGAKVG